MPAVTAVKPEPRIREEAPTPRESSAQRPEGTAIEVRDLGIRYNLRLTRKTTLKGSLSRLFRSSDIPTHFWALRHLNFRIEYGEAVAVIGPNGAGKTTLLLALAKILLPSEGHVRLNGRVSTLLTLGAGFDAELSGRDNIELAGAFLGMPHRDIVELSPSIIDFADIGPFIDAPVKTYSAGMRARLGFAIATSIRPDILLLDEVLGTGDASFKARSQNRIRDLLGNAKCVVLVTHDLSYVTEYCRRAILLEKGTIIHDGTPGETVALYRQRVQEQKLLAESEAKRFAALPETSDGSRAAR